MASDTRFLDPTLTRLELQYRGYWLYRTEDGHEFQHQPQRWTYGVPAVIKVCRLKPLQVKPIDEALSEGADWIFNGRPRDPTYTEHVFYPVRPLPEAYAEHCYWKDEQDA